MSALWARATRSRTAFEASAPHPCAARCTLTSRRTSASAAVIPPLAAVPVAGAALWVGLAEDRGPGKGGVRLPGVVVRGRERTVAIRRDDVVVGLWAGDAVREGVAYVGAG